MVRIKQTGKVYTTIPKADKVYKELMKYKSFRESTPRTREEKLRRAINRRMK